MKKIRIIEETTLLSFSRKLHEELEKGYKIINSNLTITGEKQNLIKYYYAYLEKED